MRRRMKRMEARTWRILAGLDPCKYEVRGFKHLGYWLV
jgi:hypothetical protein